MPDPACDGARNTSMMAHAMVLIWALVFGTGIAGIATIYARWRHERAPLLSHYRRFLVLANLTVGGLLVLTYVAANMTWLRSAGSRWPVAPLFLAVSFWMVAAFVCELTMVALLIGGRRLSARARWGTIATLAVVPVVVLIGLLLADRGLRAERVFAVSEILNEALIVGGMVMMLSVLGRPRPGLRPRDRWAADWFRRAHVAALALIVGAALLIYPWAWYALVVSFLVVNLSPFLLLEFLLVVDAASQNPDAGDDEALAAFVARLGISVRERDIVRLLLRGCRNQEIGEALFISSHTVKNHVYNVYRKAGVRNRVQLANLVRGR